MLHFVNGDLVGKDVEMMDEPIEDDSEAVSELVSQYYTAHRGGWPKSILLPVEIENTGDLEELLLHSSGRKIYIEYPKRGERAKLIESARLNAQEEIQRRTTQTQRRSKTLEWLQKALNMETYPERIEAYDISNLASSGIVSAMTVFVDGKPLKRDYRKFRIRDLEHPDDYASMYQTIYRRIKHYLDGDGKFSPLPELFLIDGGEVHANTAKKAMNDLGVDCPVFGMVKDDRHRTRALITPEGHEISIQSNPALFALIGSIQDETHRFAIEFQRSVRNEGYTSTLEKIPGIGEKRRTDLIKYFKSVKAIKEASVQQLNLVVPKNTAQAIYDYYHKEDNNNESDNRNSAGQKTEDPGEL